ncbi:MAG: hypothetical protein E7662_04195 [Ruminococcaceae bacterium]|nr:hypothetical protein [Oscillospiraceae bacterium]
MRLSISEFLCEKLDYSIPALAGIPALVRAGDIAAAEAVFAGYIRKTLDPDRFFRIPYRPMNTGREILREETERQAAQRLAKGGIVAVGFCHYFPGGCVDYNVNPTPDGYVEWTQLHRHPEFRMLGHLYREEPDETYVETFLTLFNTWYEQCECPGEELPTGRFVGPFASIHIGIRLAFNWFYALHAFLPSPRITDHFISLFFTSVWENANRLRMYPSFENWLIMEMNGLFFAGTLCPFFADGAEWQAYAAARLTQELENSLYPEGFQYEMTTAYHSVAVSNYTQAAELCLAYGVDAPFMDALGLAFDFYPKMSKGNFRLPALNDGEHTNVAYWCSEGLKYFPEKEHLRFFASAGREGNAPAEKDTILPYCGIAVLRDGWGRDDQWAFFESGPLGRAHQHEDKLMFLLSAYGRDMLDDPGCSKYDKSLYRSYEISSFAHNTGVVDGLSQNRRGVYRWRTGDPLDQSAQLAAELGADADVLDGVYDEGYGANQLQATHRRRVIKVKKHPFSAVPFYVIIDRYESRDGAEHTYETLWNMKDVPLTVLSGDTMHRIEADFRRRIWKDEDGIRHEEEDRRRVTLTLFCDGEMTVRRGCTSPCRGWAGRDKPAPALSFARRGSEAQIVTVLCPSDTGCPITRFTADENGVTVFGADTAFPIPHSR